MRWCSGQQFLSPPPPSVGLAGDRCVVKNERQSKMKRTKVKRNRAGEMYAGCWWDYAAPLVLQPEGIQGQELAEGPWWSEEEQTHSSPVEWNTSKWELFYQERGPPPPGIWSLSDGSNIEWWRGRSSNTITMFRNKRRQIFTRCAGVFFQFR